VPGRELDRGSAGRKADGLAGQVGQEGVVQVCAPPGEGDGVAAGGGLVGFPSTGDPAMKDKVESELALHGGGVLRGAGESGDVLPITEGTSTINRKRALIEK
jgi:hypothetical protein